MRQMARKSTPRVIRGVVQKKNNWDLSTDYYAAPAPRTVVVDRKRPGEGYRHVVSKRDILRFLEILPDWDRLAVGLNAVVLAPGRRYVDGYHVPGVVHLCAWEAELWRETDQSHYEAHRAIFERLGVDCVPVEDYWLCRWEEEQARAYQLLHILLHELGHHHDRMTTGSQKQSCRGEPYAEEYAVQYEAQIWDAFTRAFAF